MPDGESRIHPAERDIIESFIAGPRRHRYLFLLEAGRRVDAVGRLNHCRDLDPRFTSWIPQRCHGLELLREHGAGTRCYCFSAVPAIDGRELPLEAALNTMYETGWGSILRCIPGRLAYYYDELGSRHALLQRPGRR